MQSYYAMGVAQYKVAEDHVFASLKGTSGSQAWHASCASELHAANALWGWLRFFGTTFTGIFLQMVLRLPWQIPTQQQLYWLDSQQSFFQVTSTFVASNKIHFVNSHLACGKTETATLP